VIYDAAAFAEDYGLSAEARARCAAYAALLLETQAHTNLIGPATVPELWLRHFSDSAQLLALGRDGRWLDIGSGAGFPGIVLAIMGADVDMIEARQKKAAFIARVIEALDLGDRARVNGVRVEQMAPFQAANITARALANLDQLFDWGRPFAARSTRWILPKGASAAPELDAAAQRWRFTHRLVNSQTAEAGRIVVAAEVRRRERCE